MKTICFLCRDIKMLLSFLDISNSFFIINFTGNNLVFSLKIQKTIIKVHKFTNLTFQCQTFKIKNKIQPISSMILYNIQIKKIRKIILLYKKAIQQNNLKTIIKLLVFKYKMTVFFHLKSISMMVLMQVKIYLKILNIIQGNLIILMC